MNGRLEQEQKIFCKIESKMHNYPLFIQEWILNLRASGCSSKTCRDYLNKITRYLKYINENVNEITPYNLDYKNTMQYFVFIRTRKDETGDEIQTSDSFQQTVWCCLNSLFSFLVDRQYIKVNIMDMIKKPKNKDLIRINEDRILLNEFDFTKILQSVESGCGSQKAKSFQSPMRERDISIMLIFMTTGIRKDALASINIDDIDLNNKILTIIDKGDIRHYYELTDKTIMHIKAWLEKRRKNDTNALFISYQGKRLSGNSVYKLVEKYCEDALGYKISPHKLRSGFCSIMYSKTGDIEKVRRMVGHANAATTQRYVVTKHRERTEAANIMSKLFSNEKVEV